MAPLHYTAKFDPFLSLDCVRVEGMGGAIGGAIQGKEGDLILQLSVAEP